MSAIDSKRANDIENILEDLIWHFETYFAKIALKFGTKKKHSKNRSSVRDCINIFGSITKYALHLISTLELGAQFESRTF